MTPQPCYRFIAAGFLCFFLLCDRSPGQAPSAVPGSYADIPSSADVNNRFAQLKALKIDGGSITSVERVLPATRPASEARPPGSLPARTVVKMLLNPAKGSNINVELWLADADKWNGRLLGLGNGGSAGHINSASLGGYMPAGWAAVTTDMGTSPNANSGIDNQEVWKDFGFRATHLMTTAAKQVLKAYYGKDPEHSYFFGGSTGGQQSLQEAQRYPDDYDGIIAKVPAHCRTPLHAYFLWNNQILAKCPFTPAQQKSVIAAGTEYMAGRETPPIAGKFVSDPRCTSKDIEAVIQLAQQKDPTLTAQHADALRKLFDGPKHAITGERIFNGIPIGASFAGATGNTYLFNWVFGAKKPLAEIDFGKDFDTYTAALGPYLNAENPDLTPFWKRGGKLIMFSGSADEVVPYHATVNYYERVIERLGSSLKVASFFKYYIVPGMAHGNGGPGINATPGTLEMVELVKAWREQGTAPGAIHVQRVVNNQKLLDMPVYPYPMKPGWDAATSTFIPVPGERGGVEPVSPKCLPPPAE